nr:diguanylate cyclase [Brevibacillus daliensis]
MTITRKQKHLHEARKLFLQELHRHIKHMEEQLLIHESVGNRESAYECYRIAHTLKGSAPLFGLNRIGKMAETLAHEFEWTQNDEKGLATIEQIALAKNLIEQFKIEHNFSQNELLHEEKQMQEENMMMLEKQTYRLLLIDDDQVLSSYLKTRLQEVGYQVETAVTVGEAKLKLREQTFDLITLELMMHPESGYEIFEFVRNDLLLKWVPLIVLSSRKNSKDKLRCFRMGADQYLTKPFHFEELEAIIFRLLTRMQHYEQMAFHDPLTGVANRRYFDHQLQIILQDCEQRKLPVTLAFIDIDNFKKINDQHGHQFGDLVLQGLSYKIQQNLRASDLLARYGGEEFVIAFPFTSITKATELLEQVLDHVQHEPVVQAEGEDFFITFSAGLAEWNGNMTKQSWIENADHAMYEAKRAGRNRICVSHLTDQEKGKQVVVRKKKLLLADDDAIIRSMLTAKLAHPALTILEAGDGETAWEMMKRERPHLCILDGIMPKLDGFTLLEQIRQDEDLQKMKVLMLSGRNREVDIVQGLTLGADDYMSKPFSMIELELRVKRMLQLE